MWRTFQRKGRVTSDEWADGKGKRIRSKIRSRSRRSGELFCSRRRVGGVRD
jgi:hypothetical protein